MSYYEWVQNLQLLKTAPIDYDKINYLENQKINYNKYVMNRLTIHVIKTINTRLNNSLSNCIKEMNSNIDINTLSMQFVNMKNEKEYVIKLANLSTFGSEEKNILNDFINQKFNYIIMFLTKRISLIDGTGEYMNSLKQILLNSVEE